MPQHLDLFNICLRETPGQFIHFALSSAIISCQASTAYRQHIFSRGRTGNKKNHCLIVSSAMILATLTSFWWGYVLTRNVPNTVLSIFSIRLS